MLSQYGQALAHLNLYLNRYPFEYFVSDSGYQTCDGVGQCLKKRNVPDWPLPSRGRIISV
jgi:hypothetical protein